MGHSGTLEYRLETAQVPWVPSLHPTIWIFQVVPGTLWNRLSPKTPIGSKVKTSLPSALLSSSLTHLPAKICKQRGEAEVSFSASLTSIIFSFHSPGMVFYLLYIISWVLYFWYIINSMILVPRQVRAKRILNSSFLYPFWPSWLLTQDLILVIKSWMWPFLFSLFPFHASFLSFLLTQL